MEDEARGFYDTAPWKTLPGVTHTGGHLTLHIEGIRRSYRARDGAVDFVKL